MKYNRILVGKDGKVLRRDVGLIIPDEKKETNRSILRAGNAG